MFESNMVEGISNKVLIEDVEPDIMSEVLRFIYTDKTSNIDKMSDLLLAAADKVSLKQLDYIIFYNYGSKKTLKIYLSMH